VDLDTVADNLYGLPPEEFTAARDDAAKRADDAALKKAIKSLRKPTASAHAVNVLARAEPGALDELLELGAQLRTAMSGGQGDVRRLTEQRRELIGSLVGGGLPTTVQADVTATLEAATADPDLGAAVRSGRLVKPLRYAGFGALPDLDDAVATPGRTAPRAPRAAPAKETGTPSARQAAKQAVKQPAKPQQKAAPPKPPALDLSAIRQRVLDLAGAADDAQRRYDEASRAVLEARGLLERAEAERAEAHKAAREAHAAVDKARRELGRLERS